MRILAGDIGGTKTILQVADVYPNMYKVVFEKQYASQNYPEFLTLLKEFLKEAASKADMILSSACLGVAGPITGTEASVTNLPWHLNAADLCKETGIAHMTLINDFQAIGYGLEALSEQEIFSLQEGQEVKHGPRVVIGAGTGLGEGVMYWQGDHYNILPSEGGHSSFAPVDDGQIALLQYLKQENEHVTYEHVLSGRGLCNIYDYLRDSGVHQEAEELRADMQSDDPAAVISRYAMEEYNPLAVAALDMFCRIYGAQAGNLALTCLATGGVYIAGGIAPKIIKKLQDDTFINAFRDKNKMSHLLEAMPVRVVLNPQVGVRGAALVASRSGK